MAPSFRDPYGGTPDEDDPKVCYCRHVHRREVVDAIRRGARSVEALQQETGASTGCGTCRFDLVELLARHGGGEERS